MNFIKIQRCFSSRVTSLLTNRQCYAINQQNSPFQTYAALSCGKHPIQQFGAAYLDRQKQSHRPLSPHLQIYKPQWTWWVSGAHRILGCVMGGFLIVFTGGMIFMPFDFTAFIEFFRHLGLPTAITTALKFTIAFPIVFHYLNGIRFLGFDMAYMMDIKNVYLGAYTVVGLSVVLALMLALWRKQDKK